MKPFPSIDMAEVTRLTREGRLDEAMRMLRGEHDADAPAATSPTDETRAAGNVAAEAPPIIDMQPPSAANGGAWTAPSTHEPSGSPSPSPPSSSPSMAPSSSASTLRSTLDRMLKPRVRVGASVASTETKLPPGARWEERSYANAGDSRNYKLYVPSSHDGTPMPLVVMLHGCTQTPDDFARGTRMNELCM